jgi:hypothetical protein
MALLHFNDANLNYSYEPVEGALPVAPAQDSGRAMGIRCNVCCRSLARYAAEPAPLPVERRLLLVQLEAFPAEVRQRLS